jgi:hypothetical protein
LLSVTTTRKADGVSVGSGDGIVGAGVEVGGGIDGVGGSAATVLVAADGAGVVDVASGVDAAPGVAVGLSCEDGCELLVGAAVGSPSQAIPNTRRSARAPIRSTRWDVFSPIALYGTIIMSSYLRAKINRSAALLLDRAYLYESGGQRRVAGQM